MIRSTVIKAIAEYLLANYSGPVAVLTAEDDEDLVPPYAIVRVGSSEAMAPGLAELWDMAVYVAVVHDAEATTIETAEAQAGELFEALDDGAAITTATTAVLAVSAWERTHTEASIAETRWQHIAGFRLIVSPAADEESQD